MHKNFWNTRVRIVHSGSSKKKKFCGQELVKMKATFHFNPFCKVLISTMSNLFILNNLCHSVIFAGS